MPKFDYRRSRRVRLKRSAPAMVAGRQARITDVSVEGIGIVHQSPLVPGSETPVEFTWGGTVLTLRCTVAATHRLPDGGMHRSGLEVVGGLDVDTFRQRARQAVASLLEYESTLPPTL